MNEKWNNVTGNKNAYFGLDKTSKLILLIVQLILLINMNNLQNEKLKPIG